MSITIREQKEEIKHERVPIMRAGWESSAREHAVLFNRKEIILWSPSLTRIVVGWWQLFPIIHPDASKQAQVWQLCALLTTLSFTSIQRKVSFMNWKMLLASFDFFRFKAYLSSSKGIQMECYCYILSSLFSSIITKERFVSLVVLQMSNVFFWAHGGLSFHFVVGFQIDRMRIFFLLQFDWHEKWIVQSDFNRSLWCFLASYSVLQRLVASCVPF